MNIQGSKILIVENEEDLQKMFRQLFETMGAVVTALSTCEAAFTLLKYRKFDLVISNHTLDGLMKGIQFISFPFG